MSVKDTATTLIVNDPPLISGNPTFASITEKISGITENKAGKPWFVLFHGIYKTQSQAAKAVRELSPTLSRAKPWVRRLPRGGNIEALEPTP